MKKAFLFLVEYAKQNNISFNDAARRYLLSNGVFQSAVKDYILRAGRIPNVGIIEQAKQAGYLVLENGGDYLENFLQLEPGEIPTLYRRFNFYGFANEFPVAFVACVILASEDQLANPSSNFLFLKAEQTKKIKQTANNAIDWAKDTAGQVADAAKKVAFAPFRGPFLLLVRLNVFNLARRIVRAIEKDRQRMKNFWENEIGGDFAQLVSTAEKGKKEMPILPGKSQTFTGSYSSAEPVSTTAAIAAATPITVKITALLSAIGVALENAEDIAETAKNLAQRGKDLVGGKPAPTTPGATPPIVPRETPSDKPSQKPKRNNTTMLLLVGGALVAAYLIYKKKI
jgi:hypothetical protein